jgi:hypothetical protein
MIARQLHHLSCSGILNSQSAPNLTGKHGQVCIRHLCVSDKLKDARAVPVAVFLQNKDQNSEARTSRKQTATPATKMCWGQTRRSFPTKYSNYRRELELWLCSRIKGFANWPNCVVTFFEGGRGNFLALADVTLCSHRLGQLCFLQTYFRHVFSI